MSITKFTLIVPSIGYEKTIALTINECERQPNAVPICEMKNECNYYINRFKDFMQRHPDCSHEPPEYYFGKMRKLGELTTNQKWLIHLKNTTSTRLAPIGETEAITKIKEKEKEQLLKDQKSLYKYKRGKIEKVPTPEESYGYKYCKAFTELLEDKGLWKLSKEGKEWLKRTREDLQKYLEAGVYDKYYVSQLNHDYNQRNGLIKEKKAQKEAIKKFYTDIELRNDKFKEFAFATHPDAYNPEEMSNLPINDLIIIGLTPELKELFKKETWEQIEIVLDNIDIKKISEATWKQIENFGKKMGRKIEKNKETLQNLWNELNK